MTSTSGTLVCVKIMAVHVVPTAHQVWAEHGADVAIDSGNEDFHLGLRPPMADLDQDALDCRVCMRRIRVRATRLSVLRGDFPWRLVPLPQILQQALVAQRIHALPEAFVLVGAQLAVFRESLQRLILEPYSVSRDELEDFRLQNEESAVDPARLGLRLLHEFGDRVAIEPEVAKTGRGAHRCEGAPFSVALVKGEQPVDVHVGNTVAVGEHESGVADQVLDALHAAGGGGVQAGVDQIDGPVAPVPVAVPHDVAGAEVYGQVAAQPRVLHDVALDVLALVTQADHELLQPVSGVILHDVPQDRAAADVDHPLGPDVRFLGETCAHSAGKNNDLHRYASCWTAVRASRAVSRRTGVNDATVDPPGIARR